MTVDRGDLVLVLIDGKVRTCVILTNRCDLGIKRKFFYAHCIETSTNLMIYASEITSLVCKEFNINIEPEEELLEMDYYWYQILMDAYSSFPYFWFPTPEDDEE